MRIKDVYNSWTFQVEFTRISYHTHRFNRIEGYVKIRSIFISDINKSNNRDWS